jgi:hypothetical protein
MVAQPWAEDVGVHLTASEVAVEAAPDDGPAIGGMADAANVAYATTQAPAVPRANAKTTANLFIRFPPLECANISTAFRVRRILLVK